MKSKMTCFSKLTLGMICGYILSLAALFLPVIKIEDEQLTFMKVIFLNKDDLGMMEKVLDDVIGTEKTLMIIAIILSVAGCILFLMNISVKVKCGAAVVMAIASGLVYFQWEIICILISVLGDTGATGIGLWLELIIHVFLIIFPLVCLCMDDTSYFSREVEVFKKGLSDSQNEIEESKSFGKEGVIIIVKGECAGMEVPIDDGECIVLGRNSEECNLIITGAKISRKHCSVKYDREEQKYSLTDYSSNGTYFADGIRLEPLTPIWVKSGTQFFMGDRRNVFQLK